MRQSSYSVRERPPTSVLFDALSPLKVIPSMIPPNPWSYTARSGRGLVRTLSYPSAVGLRRSNGDVTHCIVYRTIVLFPRDVTGFVGIGAVSRHKMDPFVIYLDSISKQIKIRLVRFAKLHMVEQCTGLRSRVHPFRGVDAGALGWVG